MFSFVIFLLLSNWSRICSEIVEFGHFLFIAVFLGRLPKVDLIILEGGEMCVRTYVRTYVRPSTKSFFDFNEIWYIGRGR